MPTRLWTAAVTMVWLAGVGCGLRNTPLGHGGQPGQNDGGGQGGGGGNSTGPGGAAGKPVADGGLDLAPTADGATGGAGGTGAADGTGGMGGAPAPAMLAIDPTSKDLSTVVISHFADATFQVSNTGGLATSLPAVSLDGTDAAQYTLTTNTCTAAIAPGKTCDVTVRFTPTATGLKSARVNVSAAMGGAAAATLQGSGVMQGALTVTPANQDMGSVLVGQKGTAITFTVTNTGGSATGALVTNIADSTELAISTDGCMGMALAATKTCTIAVTLSPTSSGKKSATLSVTGSPGGTTSAGLTGVGLAPAALAISPTTATLPATAVGATSAAQTFTVSNTGDVTAGATATPLAITIGGTNMAEFAIASTTCMPTLAAGASCTVGVTFKPTTTGANKAATLTATATPGNSATVTLAATSLSAASLSLDLASGAATDFGTVVTNASSSQTFVVSNGGQQATSALTIGATGTDFTVVTPGTGDCVSGTTTLGAGASCTIHLKFGPTTAGSKTSTLSVSATAGGTDTLALTGVAVPPGALTLTPVTQSFGSILQGTSGTPVTLTVMNTGGATTGTLSTSVTGSTEFAIGPDNCRTKTLAAAGTCTIVVTFSPASAGQKTGTLSVSATPGGTATSTLNGIGLALAQLTISPTVLTFPPGTVSGMTSAAQTFTVTNIGGVASSAVTATLGSTNANQFSIASNTCTTVGAGLTCSIGVTFKPTSAGSKTATLTATATTGGSATSTLSAAALSPATVALAPASGSSIAFGAVQMGQSALETFVVSNTGQQASSALTIGLTGADFALVAPAAGDCVSGTRTLQPSETCTVSVRFTPTAVASRTATLTVNATTGGMATQSLTGSGFAPSAISLMPTTQGFGSVLQQTPSASHMFTVTNTGGASTGALSTVITGSDFSITAETCKGAVLTVGGAPCTITVVMTPASPGGKTGTLTVTGNPGGSVSAALSGTGLAPALLALSPTSASFAPTVIGQSSTGQVFTVTNNGGVASGVPAATLSGTNAGDFTVTNGCTAALGPGVPCSVTVTFHPGSSGNKTATLTVTANPGGTVTATPLMGTGQSAAVLTLTGATDFGTLATGSRSATPQTFTVTNTGQQTSGVLTVTPPGGDFALAQVGTTPCVSGSITLLGGGTCTIGVNFAPTAIGMRTGRLAVSANPGGSPSANLTGNGKLPTGTFAQFRVPPEDPATLLGLVAGTDGNLYFSFNRIRRMSIAPATAGMITELPASANAHALGITRNSAGKLFYAGFDDATASPTMGTIAQDGTGFSVVQFPTLGVTSFAQIFLTSDGSLWLPDAVGGGAVYRMTTAGAQLPSISGTIGQLAVDSTGTVWGTGPDTNTIERFSAAGVSTGSFPVLTLFAQPWGICVGGDGNIWFSEPPVGKIGKFTIATSHIDEFTLPLVPGASVGGDSYFCTVGADGNVWFTEMSFDVVARVTPAGVITQFPLMGGAGRMTNIVSAPDGNLYFLEQNSSFIGRISP